MCTPLTARKGDDLALGQFLPANRAAEAEAAGKDDQQLLALDVIVEHHLLAGLEFIDARAEVLGASALADSDRAEAIGGRVDGII
jgi:hypothetical protein